MNLPKTSVIDWNIFRRKREEMGLSMRQVGDLTGLNFQRIGDAEGRHRPSGRTTVMLMYFYGLTPKDLLADGGVELEKGD